MFLCMRIVYLWYTSFQMWNESAESKKNGEAGRKKNEEKGMKKRRSRNTANFILSHPGF